MHFFKTITVRYAWSATEETHAQINQGTLVSGIFVKYCVDKEEIKVEYCPTHVILADLFTNQFRNSYTKRLEVWLWVTRPSHI